MPILIAFLALAFAFLRELRDLFKQPKYRSLLLWLAFLLGIGTLFYSQTEGWSLLDALYFCVATLATVGYGDLTPTTSVGKAFVIIYIFIGMSFLGTFVHMLAKERQFIRQERQDKGKVE